MSKYCVGFFKHLLSCKGGQFKCLQEQIEVDAKDAAEAKDFAARTFEALHRIQSWQTRADAIEVLSDRSNPGFVDWSHGGGSP